MKVATWLRWLAGTVLAVSMMVAVAGVLPGCSGSNGKPKSSKKEKVTKNDKEMPKDKGESKVKPEEPAPSKPAPGPAEKPPAKAEKAAPDATPTAKISTYAPAADLVAQVPEYLKDLEKAVADEATFKDSESKIGRCANTMILVAVALGLHDEDNKYKAAAPAMFKAAKEVAAAKDYAAAKKAVDALKAATEATGGDAGELKWDKTASLEQLMKAVPIVRNKIKSSSLSSASRLKKKADDYAGHSAILAVIAQGSLSYAGETKAPTEVEKWQQFCIEMRNTSAALNAAIRAGDTKAATKIQKEDMEKTCTHCHEVFKPEE